MPELPEVETMVRDLAPRVIGRTITGARASFQGSVIWPDFPEFAERVAGRRITAVSRRGKYAIFTLDSGDALIIHRGMSGSVLLRPTSAPLEPYVRIAFDLDDGTELRFNDPRKFGKVYVMEAGGAERPMPWVAMGPEPLETDFTAEVLGERLQGRRALIKPLLLNQQILAGLGNIYVDESLFRAGIHPERRANTLTEEETTRLHAAIRDILTIAVEGRGTTFNSYTDINGQAGGHQRALQVFHRQGEACPRCGTLIVKFVVGGRGTHICPDCQKAS
jgi:formamidopyrimidine-DNA glycosylase